jgi:hypothetical protein
MLFRPKHTAVSVAKRIAEGLRDGTVTMSGAPEQQQASASGQSIPMETRRSSSNTTQPVKPKRSELIG